MNSRLIPALIFVFSLFIGLSLHAQPCDAMFPMEEGVKFEQTSYSAKDKVTGYQRHEILKVETKDNWMAANISVKISDKKDKETASTEYEMICEDGNFHLDMRAMLASMDNANFNMDMDIQSENLSFPSNLSVGQELPDASLKATMDNGTGFSIGGISVNITERKVLAKESITTPAGTFDCYVLSQKEASKVMGIKINSESKSWYAKDVGMVRSEYYRKGKLQEYTLLTKLER